MEPYDLATENPFPAAVPSLDGRQPTPPLTGTYAWPGVGSGIVDQGTWALQILAINRAHDGVAMCCNQPVDLSEIEYHLVPPLVFPRASYANSPLG